MIVENQFEDVYENRLCKEKTIILNNLNKKFYSLRKFQILESQRLFCKFVLVMKNKILIINKYF